MTKQHGTDTAGNALDLVGNVIHTGRGSVPGLLMKEGDMPKADRDGLYVLNGNFFKARKDQPIPDGAEMFSERSQKPATETKAQKAAPENKAQKPATETKST